MGPTPPLLTLSLLAPAKINLWLWIRNRRADGYHEIETRLAPLDLCDRLTLEKMPHLPAGEVRFSCDDASLPGDETNLVVRAVRALEPATGPLPGMGFHLEKRIPHGAGLGGGSSDAAAALRLVRAAFRPELPDSALQQAAAAVGSDVPFFLLGQVGDATGRGEVVAPVADAGLGHPAPRVLLVKLPFGIATPWAYRAWHAAKAVPGLPYLPQPHPLGLLGNDLECPVFEKFQVLGHLKAALLAAPGVTACLLSGSGSTVFALLEEEAPLAPIVDAVKAEVGSEVTVLLTRLAPVQHRISVPADTDSLPARNIAF